MSSLTVFSIYLDIYIQVNFIYVDTSWVSWGCAYHHYLVTEHRKQGLQYGDCVFQPTGKRVGCSGTKIPLPVGANFGIDLLVQLPVFTRVYGGYSYLYLPRTTLRQAACLLFQVPEHSAHNHTESAAGARPCLCGPWQQLHRYGHLWTYLSHHWVLFSAILLLPSLHVEGQILATVVHQLKQLAACICIAMFSLPPNCHAPLWMSRTKLMI